MQNNMKYKFNTSHPFLARSKLYNLAPIGVGTPFVESLTSYLSRLAEAHSVSIWVLIVKLILPGITLEPVYSHGVTEYKKLNGTCNLSKSFVQYLEELTSRNDIRYLTMNSWSEVISNVNLFRRYKAWCPECFEGWYRKKDIVYEPLIWNFSLLKNCSLHQKPLETKCPYCKRQIQITSSKFSPGYCPKCQRWLGRERKNAIIINTQEYQWENWLSNNLGDLLALAPASQTPPSLHYLSKLLSEYIELLGNKVKLSRLLEISLESIAKIIASNSKVCLDTLSKVSYCLDLSLGQILTQELPQPSNIHIRKPAQIEPNPKKRYNFNLVKTQLEAALESKEYPFPSVRELSRRLNFNRTTIGYKFPELCQEISRRSLLDRKQFNGC